MKKTILVTAIAAIISGPAAAIETDFYGNIRLSLRTADSMDIDSSKLILGWKGSEDLGNGLTAAFKIELEQDDANTKNGVWDNDRSWVSIAGDFGKVTLGREDTFDGWANAGTDIFAINGGNGYFAGNELDNGIQYRYSSGMLQFGIGAELFDSDGASADPTSDAVNTTYGISFAGENWQVGAHGADADSNAPTDKGIGSAIAPGDAALNIGGYYTLGNFTLGVTVGDDGSATDSDVIDVVLAFPLGPCGALVGMSSGDAPDAASVAAGTGPSGDIVNLGYNCGTGAAYYGFEYNDDDAKADAVAILYYGLRF